MRRAVETQGARVFGELEVLRSQMERMFEMLSACTTTGARGIRPERERPGSGRRVPARRLRAPRDRRRRRFRRRSPGDALPAPRRGVEPAGPSPRTAAALGEHGARTGRTGIPTTSVSRFVRVVVHPRVSDERNARGRRTARRRPAERDGGTGARARPRATRIRRARVRGTSIALFERLSPRQPPAKARPSKSSAAPARARVRRPRASSSRATLAPRRSIAHRAQTIARILSPESARAVAVAAALSAHVRERAAESAARGRARFPAARSSRPRRRSPPRSATTVTDIYDAVVEAWRRRPTRRPTRRSTRRSRRRPPRREPLARRRALLDDLGVEGAWSAHPATHAMALEPPHRRRSLLRDVMLDPVGTSVDVAQAPARAPESEPAYRRRALLQDDYVEDPIADLIHSTADAPAAAPEPAYRRRALRQVDDIPTAMPIDEPTITMMPVDEPAIRGLDHRHPREDAIGTDASTQIGALHGALHGTRDGTRDGTRARIPPPLGAADGLRR